MADLFASRRRQDNTERAAAVKARMNVAAAARLLGVDHESGIICPLCGGFTLVPSADRGERFSGLEARRRFSRRRAGSVFPVT